MKEYCKEDIIKHFDDRAPYYVERLRHLDKQDRWKLGRQAIDSLRVKKGKALDVGCGVGVYSKYLAEAGFTVAAIDFSGKVIEIAKEYNPHPNITYIQQDITEFDSEEKFDLILFSDVLEHLPSSDVFGVVRRITKYNIHENTVIIVELPDANFIKFMEEYYPEKLQIIDNGYSIDHIVSMFEYCDFIPARISIFGIDTDVQYNRYLFTHRKAFEKHYAENLKRIYRE